MTTLRARRPFHHWYFLAGIATVLTLGAGWGVWLLWQLAVVGRFTGLSLQDVNAHGQAQIDGWVGLFIMGFALQMFPPVWQTRLAGHRWALHPLWAMLGGIVLRFLGMSVVPRPAGAWLAASGSLLQVGATMAFAGMLVWTFRRSLASFEPWVGFVMLALACFVLQAAFDGWHVWMTMAAPDRDALLRQVSTFQAPLRDVQIHGLALCMILGVSIRFLPPLFGLPPVSRRRGWTALLAIAAALASECVFFVLLRTTGRAHWGIALWVAWLLLAAGCALVALPWRLWQAPPDRATTAKFVRLAYAWLGASLVMLILLPAYRAMSGLPFSHAYYGAIRHAVTVGFISQMIVGISSTVVPLVHRRAALRSTFLLLNLGCGLRVGLQVASDWTPHAFHLIGISGVLEFLGLSVWAAVLVAQMWQRRRTSVPGIAVAGNAG